MFYICPCLAYIEIEKSENGPVKEGYEIIKSHLGRVLGAVNRHDTKFEHSYDSRQKVFRFHMSSTGKGLSWISQISCVLTYALIHNIHVVFPLQKSKYTGRP